MASVDDETDLSTLTGENDKYRLLVEAKFQCEFGNVTWEAVQLMTKDEFLVEYGSGAGNLPAVRTLLRAWMKHYELEARFKQSPPSQQNGELRCCFRIHSCLCCFQKDITVPNSLLPVAR
jgi:hypothetical protein